MGVALALLNDDERQRVHTLGRSAKLPKTHLG